MFKKLRGKLKALGEKLSANEQALERAKHRWEKWHLAAVHNHHEAKKAERLSAQFAKSSPRRSRKEAKKAKRCHYRAEKAHIRAQYWVGKVKETNRKISKLESLKEDVEKEIKKLGCEVHMDRNKVTGGTPKQRIKTAMHVSAQKAREYYSQFGRWSARFCLTGPPWGYRYDCSSWFISVYWTCGLPDPSGQDYHGGWTGPLGEHGRQIQEHELDTGDAVLFGYAPYHHVEMKDGPMSEGPWTIGHGSAAVDRGTVTLLPGHRSFRRYL